MQRLHPRTPSVTQDTQTMTRSVDELFPIYAPREPDEEIEIGEISKISEAELKLAADSLKSGKSPGPDGIPVEALKAAVQTCPQLLLDMYNGCLKPSHFYKQWKVQRLVLIGKGKGDLNSADAYRALCMLQATGGLSDKQYSFRPGLSTIDAAKPLLT